VTLTLRRGARKAALAVLGYIALGVAATSSQEVDVVRAAWIAMEILGWYAIVPLALASFATGVLMSLGTRWGLFRYYWVLVTLVLTTGALVVLLLHMPDVSALARIARTGSDATLLGLGGDLFHAVGGLVVLLTVLTLNIAKPPGLTPYGWNRLRRSQR
jgi:hypothetical protein